MSAKDFETRSSAFRPALLPATLLAGEASSISPILPETVKDRAGLGFGLLMPFMITTNNRANASTSPMATTMVYAPTPVLTKELA